MRRFFITLQLALLFCVSLSAQNPVKWTYTAQDAGNCQVDLIFTGVIDDGWYTYSQFLESEDGPVATLLEFKPSDTYTLVDKAKESGEKITVEDPVFAMKLTKFKHKAILTQRITVKDASKPVTGTIMYMCCNDEMCLPPKTLDFSFSIPALKSCTK